ncbi:hypothetical protein [Natrinema versiforme]|uniref:Uncharacterized protein n=1 Tax=Natrinema versiforme JCM 10478 TaxID=1227496 RepID=L9XUH8_9EURY|nr:hypothetical protein [Natrinema versiforme]ELY65464.1 hypothetical protein C489_14340 [Natrinema versiforme JCM 10478]
MTELPRRRLLAATGTALTGAVAGCMGSDDGNGDGGNGDENESASADPETGSETTEATSGTLLGEISLENIDDEAHTIDVIVEFGDGPEHWSTNELAEDEGAELERNWPTESGSFSVMFRLDGGEPMQVTPARWNDPDCVNVFAMVGRDGQLKILSDTEGGPCGDGDVDLDDAEE